MCTATCMQYNVFVHACMGDMQEKILHDTIYIYIGLIYTAKPTFNLSIDIRNQPCVDYVPYTGLACAKFSDKDTTKFSDKDTTKFSHLKVFEYMTSC